MRLLNHSQNRITIEMTDHEVARINILIQEGRLAYDCDLPEGQVLEDAFRSIAIAVADGPPLGTAQ